MAETEEERDAAADVRGRRRGPDRRRDGGADRRDRARHAARLPRRRHRRRRACCWSRPATACWPRSRRSCPSGRASRWRPGRDADARPPGHRHRRRRRDDASGDERGARPRRRPSSGPRACSPRACLGALAEAAGRRDRQGRAADRRARPDRCPGTPRCSRSATWSRCAAQRSAARRRAGGDADGALRGQARHAAGCAAKDVGPFKYKDKGNLATIGRGARGRRAAAAASASAGFLAWALWLGIHLFYLVGFQNRLLVFIRWGFSFLTHGRGTRLITGEQNMP